MKSLNDPLASAGIADGTGLDVFFRMQGNVCFCTDDDVFCESAATDEVLYDERTGEAVVDISTEPHRRPEYTY